MTDEKFESFVHEGINALPEWVQKQFKNLVFFIKDDVSDDQRINEGLELNETLFGLYEGVPLSARGNNPPELPDTITIFKNPILQAFSNEDDIRTCIKNTVWHEVAHYFGHDEGWVEAEEKKRGMLL